MTTSCVKVVVEVVVEDDDVAGVVVVVGRLLLPVGELDTTAETADITGLDPFRNASSRATFSPNSCLRRN